LEERNHLEDVDVDGKIMLKWMLRKWDVRELHETVTGWWRHDNEPSDSKKGKKYQTGRIFAS
jgi:hypothetical protein